MVLSKHGFENTAPYKMRVGKECYDDLNRGVIPDAALANGFWVGTLPSHLEGITFVERAAAYPVRIKGHVIALESRKVNNAGGTAKRSLRGTSVFYANNSSSVATELPLAATDVLDMMTVVLAGKKKPKSKELDRLFGARKGMISDVVHHALRTDLVLGFDIVKDLQINEENLASFPEAGMPPDFAKAILTPEDPFETLSKVSSTYTRDRDEDEGAMNEEAKNDEDTDTESEQECDDSAYDGRACVIQKYAVVDSAEDSVTASIPTAMRRLGAELDPETSLRRGVPPDTRNALVVPHGDILDDINNNSAWVAAFMHAFPEGCGGPLCPTRIRPVSFDRWMKIKLNSRDDTLRKDRFFIFCAAAIKFRHEALKNVRFKLSARVNPSAAADISSITKDDLESMAAEIQSGKK